MCILCVIQKWSRRVAAMLPWLVIPLIGLWALSQLLPPGFRFEVTSPRLACVSVLLVTLCWYEIVMPRLSAWKVRRDADRREKKRSAAIEMQKLRKMATRRCRNCLSSYRDQNPAGGRFMCSYCGHVSKRPVLDISGSAADSGIVGDVIGKRGNTCLQTGWFCTNGWLCDGSGTLGRSNHKGKNGSSDNRYLTDTAAFFGRYAIFFRWLWRKICRRNSDDDSLDGENGSLSEKGENGVNFHESKGERARRKAEEKRQARLEKELLEEEERKQREEVARLVEEQRRLRDEKMEAEKETLKSLAAERKKINKRETEKRRQERRKEKDKCSSKSNSDEELERRVGKESEKKREFDKKSESDRRSLQKAATESVRAHNSEKKHAAKFGSTDAVNKGNGVRYLDRMRGSLLSSSKSLNGGGFFKRDAHSSATVVPKVTRPYISVDHIQTSVSGKSLYCNGHLSGKLPSNGYDKFNQTGLQRPVTSESQQGPAPKKSWQQLFTRSPAVPPLSNSNFTNKPIQQSQTEFQSSYIPIQTSPSYPFGGEISFGQSLPFCLSPYSNGSRSVSPNSSSAAEPNFPFIGESSNDFQSEDSDIYEDPCYIPDPVSLLGPVSESLDHFPLDLGIVSDTDLKRNHALSTVCGPVEVNRPSPIEAPSSRLRFAEGGHTNSCSFPSTPKTQDVNSSPLLDESSKEHEQGTWQMWSTPELGHDGFGLVGGAANWCLPKLNQEEVFRPSLPLPVIGSPQSYHAESYQNGGTFSPVGPCSDDNDPWLRGNIFQPVLSDDQDNFPPLAPRQDITQSEVSYGNTKNSLPSHPFELPPANCWTRQDWAVHNSEEGIVGQPALPRPHIGGLFSNPDVQSLWSFD